MAKAPRFVRIVLWIAPLVLVPVALFLAAPWLKAASQTVTILLAAAVVILGMSYANYLSYRCRRGLDEVHKAAAAFAAQWGAPAGQAVFALLLVLPPFRAQAGALIGRFAGVPAMSVDHAVVLFSLTVGFCALVLVQAMATAVVQGVWWAVKR
jgi:hypothetical protein